MRQVLAFIKTNAVMLIAMLAAIITSIIVPPNAEYLGYFDFRTLTCLFTVLLVVCALKNVRFFYTVAEKIVKHFKNVRLASLGLVYITFIGSMLIANDMALLTFLPLGYFVLISSKQEKHMCTVFILQNIAANLGGMLTPFGNPQNLYLYSKFEIPDLEFMGIMLPPFLLAIAMITASVFIFVPAEPIEFSGVERKLPMPRVITYLLLFLFALVCVFRAVPYEWALFVIPPVIFLLDRGAFLKVDYGLLLTFVFFFIFSGNMSQISAVQQMFSALLEQSTLVVSALSCQLISNVPSAILLSQFTENYRELLLGVNIGGCGTLISSLASLITFREYCEHDPKGTVKYLVRFTLFNVAYLVIMLVFCLLLVTFT